MTAVFHITQACVKLTALIALGCAASRHAIAAPITFNTALPISDGEIILREQFIYSDLSSANVDIHNLTALSVGGYGVTSKWSIFGAIPLTHSTINTDGTRNDNFNIGDAVFFSRYEVFRHDSQGATTRIAPLFGVRAPTGVVGETSDGSVDVFGGIVTTIATTDYNIGGQIIYTDNGESGNIEAGNTLAFDASLQYRVWPKNLSANTTGFLFGVLEGNVSRQSKTKISGIADLETDGTRFSISPGLQYVTQRWIFDLAITVPITDSFNNNIPQPDYSVLSGFRVNF